MIHELHTHEGTPADNAFRHVALLYSGERAFVGAAAEFIREGVAAEEPSLVVVSQRKIDLLREELGPAAAARVCFADMSDVGTNPGAIISAWDDFVRDALAEGQRVRGIGEPVHAERSEDEMAECHHHEALLNLAFADAPGFQLLCPYDGEVLPRDALDSSLMTHPLVQENGVVRESAVYRGEEMAQESFEEPLDEPPENAYEVAFDRDSLGAVRAFVSELAADVGIDGERREDLLLAISELATNSVRHGGGQGVLRAWLDLDALVCEVRDRGVIARPLTGRRRPTPGALGGYGLWLVNQVCDLVQVRARFGQTVVRMRMRRG